MKKMKCACIIGWILAYSVTDSLNAQEQKVKDLFLWKTEINGHDLYLAGSVHAGKAVNYPLPDKYIEAYKKADVLMMEVEYNFSEIESKILEYLEGDRLTEDLYFRNHLDSATQSKIKFLIGEDKFYKFDVYNGWALNMLLAGQKLKLLGYDHNFAVDKYFMTLAENDHKPVIGLDSVADQITLFKFDVPHPMQIKILERTAGNLKTMAEQEVGIIDAYYDADYEMFDSIMHQIYDLENPQIKQIYDKLFIARNKKWVEAFERITKEGNHTYFVLVGNGHYFGQENLLALLEEKGYKVERIK